MELFLLLPGQQGILEEGSRTAGVFVAGGDQHGFAGADLEHGLAGLRPSGSWSACGIILDVSICNRWLSAMGEQVVHARDYVTATLGCAKDTGAILELAIVVEKFLLFSSFRVEHLHGVDGL